MKHITLLRFTYFLIVSAFALTVRAQTTPVLWGVTHAGGADTADGTLFSIHGDGTGFNQVVNFNVGNQGASPNYLRLVMGGDGKFYGTTTQGGAYGEGSIFNVDPNSGNYTPLHSFNDTLGAFPYGGVIVASDGNLYGLTNGGGANGYGVLYSFNPSTNTFADLVDLDSATGATPYGALLQAANGKLYGLTSAGGAGDNGVVFSYDIPLKTYKDIYDFVYTAGSTPFGSLIQTADGMLYGMASVGGASNYYGTIFSFDTAGNIYTDIYDFNDTLYEGVTPYGDLSVGPNNLLYGMTTYGGTTYTGTIFSFDPAAKTYNTLFNFNDSIGSLPHGALTFDGNSTFYGTTSYGGTDTAGTVFRFDPVNNDYKVLFNFDTTTGYIPYSTLTIDGSVATGIQPVKANGDVNMELYPNPGHDFTYLSVSDNAVGGTLTVTDVTGREVMNIRLTALINRIQTGSLSGGVYTLTLRAGAFSGAKLFIKE